ncbi:MAG TPA: hypothetical protein VMR19_00685 [Candidatus Saccharimonadales bacterium]|jgi:hypothetical protein|nr:hypothetical protein [Candidatus Saccharimonadales bacterium]
MHERIDHSDKEAELLEKRPHISVFRTSPSPHNWLRDGDKYKKNQDWYVCLSWEEKDPDGSGNIHGQINLTDWDTKSLISKCAILIGKELNIPVIRHENIDNVVLWKPDKRMTKDQKSWINHLTGK